MFISEAYGDPTVEPKFFSHGRSSYCQTRAIITLAPANDMSPHSWEKHGEMSVKEDMDVDKLIEKYRKALPGIGRRELRVIIKLEYEKDCAKQGIHDKRQKNTFLRKLDRKLKRAFPEPAVKPRKAKKTKTEEDIITEVIKEYVESRPFLRGKNYMPETANDEIIDIAASRTARDPKEMEFRKLVRRVIKKYCEERNT